MTLTWKTRTSVVLLVFSVAIFGFLFNQLAIEVETGGDLNKKDITFFEKDYSATYIYENGSLGNQSELILQSNPINETHTNASITYGNHVDWFFVHPNGTVYQDGHLRGNFSIWWIFVPNVLMMFGVEGGETYNIVDPTGFLGAPDRGYTLVIDEKKTYWPYKPELKGLSGAQSSFVTSLWDDETDLLVARSTMDITVGFIEVWEGSLSGSYPRLTLKETTFPISRNRFVVLPTNIIFGIALCVIVFFLTNQRGENPPSNNLLAKLKRPKDERNEIVTLIGIGVLAIIIEVVDIWFYLYLGESGNLYFHLGFTVLVGVACKIHNYGYRWCIPAFLEVAFVFALSFVTGDPYVPPLTAFMGSTISWLGLVWASGYEKHIDIDETGKGNIVAKFM